MNLFNKVTAKPFLKWVGSKKQLIQDIDKRLPKELIEGEITTYIEPFVGSGTILFHLLSNYNIKKAYIFDVNKELIVLYQIIKERPNVLIKLLSKYEKEYLNKTFEDKEKYYYKMREEFNAVTIEDDQVKKQALFIFLNKTGYHGLYRVNSKGKFNVPFGRYKNPNICERDNLENVSEILQNVEILYGDFETSAKYINSNTFAYFDPPYKPLSNTQNFTSYSKSKFNDEQQIRLKNFFDYVTTLGVKAMLSNSDPKNSDTEDNFFDELYKDYIIERVNVKRVINPRQTKNQSITELLIRNY